MKKEEEIEIIKKDLSYQLKFEFMNWDFFVELALEAKKLADEENINFLE